MRNPGVPPAFADQRIGVTVEQPQGYLGRRTPEGPAERPSLLIAHGNRARRRVGGLNDVGTKHPRVPAVPAAGATGGDDGGGVHGKNLTQTASKRLLVVGCWLLVVGCGTVPFGAADARANN